jgi:hypothetical protein
VNWAKAVTRKARQAFWCAECQPDDCRRAAEDPKTLAESSRDVGDFGAIKPKDRHRDSGNGPRLCWSCWERMETEAKKESAA